MIAMVPVKQPRTRIGRGQGNDVALPSPSVSRFHADIMRDKDGFWIVDLNSSDGVLVNSIRISAPTRIQSGDLISIGDYILRFVTGANEMPLKPPAVPPHRA